MAIDEFACLFFVISILKIIAALHINNSPRSLPPLRPLRFLVWIWNDYATGKRRGLRGGRGRGACKH